MENPWQKQLAADDEFGKMDVQSVEMAREIRRERLRNIEKAALKKLRPSCKVIRLEAEPDATARRRAGS